MKDMSNGQRIENVLTAIPYPDQIRNINPEGKDAIRFEWRGTEYRVSGDCLVEEVGDGVLIGSDKCILLGELIKKTRLIKAL